MPFPLTSGILHTQTEMEGLVHELADHPTPAYLENLLYVMKHVIQQWQAEFAWITTIREQGVEQMGTHDPVVLQAYEP